MITQEFESLINYTIDWFTKLTLFNKPFKKIIDYFPLELGTFDSCPSELSYPVALKFLKLTIERLRNIKFFTWISEEQKAKYGGTFYKMLPIVKRWKR